jgi:hypothetical protein
MRVAEPATDVTGPRLAINYDDFLSRAAAGMQESAIRRMGSILAQTGTSFPLLGYPVRNIPWADFRRSRAAQRFARERAAMRRDTRFRPLSK